MLLHVPVRSTPSSRGQRSCIDRQTQKHWFMTYISCLQVLMFLCRPNITVLTCQEHSCWLKRVKYEGKTPKEVALVLDFGPLRFKTHCGMLCINCCICSGETPCMASNAALAISGVICSAELTATLHVMKSLRYIVCALDRREVGFVTYRLALANKSLANWCRQACKNLFKKLIQHFSCYVNSTPKSPFAGWHS